MYSSLFTRFSFVKYLFFVILMHSHDSFIMAKVTKIKAISKSGFGVAVHL